MDEGRWQPHRGGVLGPELRGYRKKIEQTFQQMDNITVYTFLYLVLSPDSTTKAKQVWCATDRHQGGGATGC